MRYYSYFRKCLKDTFSIFVILILFSSCSSKDISLQPNIILIMADDMGWGNAGYQGNDIIITPNIDQLAFNGIRFKIYSSNSGKTYELYDIANDSEESTDVSLELPELKDTLINQLNSWIKSCKQSDNDHDCK